MGCSCSSAKDAAAAGPAAADAEDSTLLDTRPATTLSHDADHPPRSSDCEERISCIDAVFDNDDLRTCILSHLPIRAAICWLCTRKSVLTNERNVRWLMRARFHLNRSARIRMRRPTKKEAAQQKEAKLMGPLVKRLFLQSRISWSKMHGGKYAPIRFISPTTSRHGGSIDANSGDLIYRRPSLF